MHEKGFIWFHSHNGIRGNGVSNVASKGLLRESIAHLLSRLSGYNRLWEVTEKHY